MPAALAPIGTTQPAPTYTSDGLSAGPPELLASAPDREGSLSTPRGPKPSRAVPAARTAFYESAGDSAYPSTGMHYPGAYGAPGPSLDAKINSLEKDLVSTVYEAGFEAGYEAGLEAARHARHSRAGVAAQTPSGAPIHKDSHQHLLPVAAPQSSEHLLQSAQAPAPQPALHSQLQPQAYGQYISSGSYGHLTPASASTPAQSAGHAAAPTHELSPAHAPPTYAVHAAYGSQVYAYTGSYSPAEKELLRAAAHAQAAERLAKPLAAYGHPRAYAAPPTQGLYLALDQTMRLLEVAGSRVPSPATVVVRKIRPGATRTALHSPAVLNCRADEQHTELC